MTTRLSISVGGAAADLISNAGGGDCGFLSLIDGFKLLDLPITESVPQLRKEFVDFVYDHYEYCYLIFCNCVAHPTHLMFKRVLSDTLERGYWTDTWHLAIFSYMLERPLKITNLYSFPHNVDYVFLDH